MQSEFDFSAFEPDGMLAEIEASGDHAKIRGWHSAVLELCDLRYDQLGRPIDRRDARGKAVSAGNLKLVLARLQSASRSRGPARCKIETIAEECNMGRRTAERCIYVLERLGLVIRGKDAARRGLRGAPLTEYTIVWSELAVLCDRNKLVRRTGADQRATHTDQRATYTDQRATGGAHGSHPGSRQGSTEREGLAFLVAEAGVFSATEAVDAALGRGASATDVSRLARRHRQKALYEMLVNWRQPANQRTPERAYEQREEARLKLIGSLKRAGKTRDEIDQQLRASGLDGLALSLASAADASIST